MFMNEREVQNILIELLRVSLNEESVDVSVKEKLTPEVLISVSNLAKRQDLAHIVAKFVHDNNVEIPCELWAKLQREEALSVYRYEQQKYALTEICRTFDESEISYIPLKGAVIRPFYPYESMRTSCDIDILIHESDLDFAVSKLESVGYRCKKRNYHDVSLFSPNNIHLELHFSIKENMDNLDAVLEDVWSYAELSEGKRYSLKKEFFVFQIYAHMAYHFISGGCGLKSLMDIWVLEHKMAAEYTLAEELLKKAGIYKFAEEMSSLADKCFGIEKRDDFSDLVLGYIFKGGVYGSFQNKIAIQKNKSGNSAFYVLKRLFLPYKSMIILYPILKKAPYLLPFCWILRWVKALFGGKTKVLATEITYINGVSESLSSDIKEIHSRLGLRLK